MERLSRRERQILDILYERGHATAAEILGAMPDPPSYSAVRALLRILEEKGHARHQADGARYVYSPSVSRARARRSALKHLIQTFFNDSTSDAVAGLIGMSEGKLTSDEISRIEALIESEKRARARKEDKP